MGKGASGHRNAAQREAAELFADMARAAAFEHRTGEKVVDFCSAKDASLIGLKGSVEILFLSLRSLGQWTIERGEWRAQHLCDRIAVQTTFSAMPLSSGATSPKNGSLPARSGSGSL
jgi:hypothetical protein